MTDLILLRPKSEGDGNVEWPDDVARLKAILGRAGYTATTADIEWAWHEFSESMCAGWMMLYDLDETNLSTILEYLEPDPAQSARVEATE